MTINKKIEELNKRITEKDELYPVLETVSYFFLTCEITDEKYHVFSDQNKKTKPIQDIIVDTVDRLYNKPENIQDYNSCIIACRSLLNYVTITALRDNDGVWLKSEFHEKSKLMADKALRLIAEVTNS